MKDENRVFDWCDNYPTTAVFLAYLLAALLGIFVFGPLLRCSIVNAQSAVVSFNDAAHLAAITDSIVGVCDTVEVEWTHYEYGYWKDWDGNGVKVFIPSNTGSAYTTYPVKKAVIICRRLVGVTIDPHPIKLKDAKCIPCPIIPGTAIITWREVK